MTKIFSVLAVLLFASVATPVHALPHPCTPVVKAKPTHMVCVNDSLRYSIQIDIVMSRPIEMCRGSNYFERKSAKVQVTTLAGALVGTLEITDGNFSYERGTIAEGTFDSDLFSLHLSGCKSPLHGGMSIGN